MCVCLCDREKYLQNAGGGVGGGEHSTTAVVLCA